MTSPRSERLVFGYYVRIEDGRFGGVVESFGAATVTESACYACRFTGKGPAERYAKRVTALTGQKAKVYPMVNEELPADE